MALITINRFTVEQPPGATGPRRPVRRAVAIGAALVATAGLSVGVTVATANPSPQVSTTNVHFVALATPYKLLTKKAFAANASFSAVVIGGATTVPTNATTVQLSVQAGGTAAGVMNFYPAGNVGGGSGQFLSWAAGGTDAQTIEENVGTADQLTFANGAAKATVTATILGYSTQVTDGDINSADGTAGQVLTNTGTGANWQNSHGGAAYTSGLFSGIAGGSFTTVGTLVVPAGSFLVSATGNVYNPSTAEHFQCILYAPDGNVIDEALADTVAAGNGETIAAQGLITTTGGTVTLQCAANPQSGSYDVVVLTALQVSSASGAVTNVVGNHPGTAAPRPKH